MATPSDKALYESVNRRVYNKYPQHSAYRSGLLVKEYKEAFTKKHGSRASPYIGESKNGLTRWFAEDWRNESGGIGYDSTNTLYRPTKRVSSKTPKTWSELSKSDISKAKNEKIKKGRVTKF